MMMPEVGHLFTILYMNVHTHVQSCIHHLFIYSSILLHFILVTFMVNYFRSNGCEAGMGCKSITKQCIHVSIILQMTLF